MTWTTQFSTCSDSDASNPSPMTQDILTEVDDIQDRIEAVYSMCKAGMRPANQVTRIQPSDSNISHNFSSAGVRY